MLTSPHLVQLVAGLLLAGLIAYAARQLGALDRTGAWAALAVGGVTFGLGGLGPAVALLTFFISSSALSRIGPDRKAGLKAHYAKGPNRDAGQVLANGSVAALLSIGYGLTGERLWLVGLSAALAAANADTWATELGVLARNRPRMITGGQTVEPGTSGAVSPEGNLAATVGSGLLGLTAVMLGAPWAAALLVTLAGVAGSTLDSLLGATLQAMYYCPACDASTERHPRHHCGTLSQHLRGWRRLGNDEVNLVSTLGAAGLAMALWAGIMN